MAWKGDVVESVIYSVSRRHLAVSLFNFFCSVSMARFTPKAKNSAQALSYHWSARTARRDR